MAPEIEFISLDEAFHPSDRGWVVYLLQAGPIPLDQVDPWSAHLARTEAGHLRGNHIHAGAHEWLVVFGGPARFHWLTAQGEIRSHTVDDERTVVHVLPGVPHALVNPGPGPTYLFSIRSRPEDPGRPHAEAWEVL